jgi:hypothetical protein
MKKIVRVLAAVALRGKMARWVIPLAVMTISSAAFARCEHEKTAWQFGRSFTGIWRTNGTICTSTSNHPENIAQIVVVRKPSHGIAGRNGPYGIAYKPNPGFKGADYFEYHVISNGNHRRGAGQVARVAINVIVE